MNIDVGSSIKRVRASKKMTLKELSEKTSLSTGFLSQLERGLTSVAVDSLAKIAKALGVEAGYFIGTPAGGDDIVVKSYEKKLFQVEGGRFIHYHLTNSPSKRNMIPKLIEILPGDSREHVKEYQHEGEEFIYVLEGILTLYLKNREYQLYPGDSAHFDSGDIHNWANYTSMTVKIITVNTPNFLREKE
ncbi:transcriptional regulator, XRE family with cupin sensor [Peptoclostridium litorale DSM 5388]|uniref:Transcriptional regulator, XRE family n=1 Tax=Peptoclostridium litorale DSM 5388 TaxID=1121324 RepID=A0A069RKI5_PEPLI|nr:XRE family transcriptional regulator [Peptoclostridium litorale]KDR96615.1 transcriptional regulator, XRE family [Peptoclostridium litorale DSM 5388]SIN68441.1 transcriptional regulator, XRE family with cupin sensor [Peptoclostridium litorale DSM 5388]